MKQKKSDPWTEFKVEREELPKASPVMYVLAAVLFAVGGAVLGAFIFIALAGYGPRYRYGGMRDYSALTDAAVAQPLFYGSIIAGIVVAELTLVTFWLRGRKK